MDRWLYKKGFSLINLDDVSRINKSNTDSKISIKFEYKSNSERWSKFHFESEKERDEYLEWIVEKVLKAEEFEPDIIGELL
jgi:hypothetical protein